MPLGNLTNSFTGSADVYYTGLRGVGFEWISSSGRYCNGWTDNTAGFQGAVGIGNATGATSIRIATPNCDTVLPMLCVEQ